MAAPDAMLWTRAAGGDHDAFAVLFERHIQAIYTFCFRRTGDWSEAEELAASVFLTAWRRRSDAFLLDGSVLPWLYGVATHLLHNRRRRLLRKAAGLKSLAAQRPEPDFADEADARLDDQRAMQEILVVLATLPTREQDVLALCVWQALSYEEAAAALRVPVGTVRSRLSRARARMRGATEAPWLILDENGGTP